MFGGRFGMAVVAAAACGGSWLGMAAAQEGLPLALLRRVVASMAAAAEQCGRARVPAVAPVATLAAWLAGEFAPLFTPRQQSWFVAAALVFAGLEVIFLDAPPAPKEPTRSLGALGIVLFAGDLADASGLVILSLAVATAVLGVAILSLMLTPFLGPLAPLLFYGANGWLLGREFFQMAARRHLPDAQAQALRRAHGGRVTLTGVLVAVGLTVPIVNIALPLLAAATFTHLFHMISEAAGPAGKYRRA